MRLEQLEYLIAIHKTHSINLASGNLHVSQQNISKAIQNLETELGFALLSRSAQGTFLTTEGLIVLNHAEKVFSELSSLKTELNLSQKSITSLQGSLRIMYANAFNTEYIYASINAFSHHFPNVNISVHQKSLARLLSALYENEIDIGLISMTDDFHLNNAIETEKLQSLSIYPLVEDHLLAAVSHTSPLAAQKSISVNKLLKHQLLFLQQESEDATTANWLFHLLCRYGTPQFHLTTNAFELYTKAVYDNVGIGFFTQSATKWLSTWMNNGIVLLPIRPSITLIHGYVLNNAYPTSSIAAAYLPYLTSQIESKS